MKKFLLKITAYVLILGVLAVLPSIIVDPYNVFHPLNMRENGVEPNRNYTKMRYLLEHPGEFDTLIFGSSHVFSLNPDHFPGSCYNCYYSCGIPEDHLATLKTLLSHGIVPERIYYGIDSVAYESRFSDHSAQRLRSQYEYSRSHPVKFWSLYLDSEVTYLAVKDMLEESGRIPFDPMNAEYCRTGATVDYDYHNIISQEDYDREVHNMYQEMCEFLATCENYPEQWEYSEIALDCMQEIVNLCRENGIALTVFVNPQHLSKFTLAVTDLGYLSFLRNLSEITPYISFCGFNRYTVSTAYYYGDMDHYNSALGDLMIDSMVNGSTDPEAFSQGFGIQVTKENVEDFLSLITDSNGDW